MRGFILLVGFFIAATQPATASSASAIEIAIRAAGVERHESLETKVALLLHLLNDSGYLFESSPDPNRRYATFSTTPKAEAERLIKKYSEESSGAPFAPYDLDSARTTEEMLRQRIGGECGTHARAFAELISHLGVPQSNLRIVSAVRDEDYRGICPLGRGSVLDSKYGDASGHVFVLLKASKKWKLVNTTSAPLEEKVGPQAAEMQAAYQLLHSRFTSKKAGEEAQENVKAAIRKLSFADIEAVDFLSPDQISKKLDLGQVVPVPKFTGLGQMGPMTIFEVVRPDRYSRHTWKERFPIIASGRKENVTCRFTLPTPAAVK